MNRKKISIICIIISVLAVASIGIIVTINKKNDETFYYKNLSLNGKYIVGIYDEKVAVYAKGKRMPLKVYDSYVGTLPYKDQKSLEIGLPAKNEKELRQIIEDFTS